MLKKESIFRALILFYSLLILMVGGAGLFFQSFFDPEKKLLFLAIFVLGLFTTAPLLIAHLLLKDKKREIYFAVSTALVFLFLLNIVIKAFFPIYLSHADYAKIKGIPFGNKSKIELIDSLRKAGLETYPNIHTCDFLKSDGLQFEGSKFFPLAGVSNRTSVYGTEDGHFPIYFNDEHGFNNPKGSWNNNTDLILVGDSFTQGAYVDTGYEIAGQLRNYGFKVLNLGIGCGGPLTYLARMREYTPKFENSTILFMFFEGNDLSDLDYEVKSPTLMSYLDSSYTQNLAGRQPFVDKALIDYITKKESEGNVHLKRAGSNIFVRLAVSTIQAVTFQDLFKKVLYKNRTYNSVEPSSPNFGLLEDILVRARNDAESHGCKFIFVYVPAFERYYKEDKLRMTFRHEQVMYAVSRNDIPIIDLTKDLARHPDPQSLFPMRVPGHYTKEGYHILAESIERKLRNFSISKNSK